MDTTHLIIILFIVVGIALLFIAIRKRVLCTATTTGKVIDLSREVDTTYDQDYDRGFSYPRKSVSIYPIFEYTVNDNKYVKKSSTSSNNYFVGQNITINYNPANPNLYYITGTFSDLILSILFIIFPTILLFIVK